MIKTGLIGIGAAGNQVILKALTEGVDKSELLGVNSSSIDLEPLVDKVDTVLLGEEGCGKDRAIAKETFKRTFKANISKFEKFRGYDIVYLVGSASGGTNSGMMPLLCKVLRDILKIKTGIIAISPKHVESIKAQRNTVECMKEILDMAKDVPYTIYDNNLVKGNTMVTFDTINGTIVEDYKILRGDLNNYSAYGIIDQMDNKKLVYTPGLFKIGKLSGIKENYLDESKLSSLILSSITKSYNVDHERDKIVKNIGYYLTLNKEVLSVFNNENSDISEKLGKSTAVFEQLNILEECTDSDGSVAVLLTGLSFPNTRFTEICDIIADAEEELKKKSESNLEQISEELSWLSDIDETDTTKSNSEDKVDDKALDDLLGNL